MIATTPEAPYWAVIFTSLRTEGDDGYDAMAAIMADQARRQAGFLGMDSARDGVGITVCYWRDEASILAWKADVAHQAVQRKGQTDWYSAYSVRIARVERAYGLGVED